MKQLTAEAQQIIDTLVQRYQFSSEAVLSLLQSMLNGNGSMAQFNHPELGGSGQWMRNGMIMTADMSNHALKNKIASLCEELAALCVSQPNFSPSVSFQAQQQTYSPHPDSQQQQSSFKTMPTASLFVPLSDFGHWWPDNLPSPNSAGSQNNAKYAYFAGVRRLAIEVSGQVTLYDTLDHQITGFSQQQARDGSITFTSQHGTVALNSLPIVARDNPPQQSPVKANSLFAATESHTVNNPVVHQEADIFAALEKLADLKSKGILTESEYSAKKAQLLARL
jgi:hypothetical protein